MGMASRGKLCTECLSLETPETKNALVLDRSGSGNLRGGKKLAALHSVLLCCRVSSA